MPAAWDLGSRWLVLASLGPEQAAKCCSGDRPPLAAMRQQQLGQVEGPGTVPQYTSSWLWGQQEEARAALECPSWLWRQQLAEAIHTAAVECTIHTVVESTPSLRGQAEELWAVLESTPSCQ